MSDGDSIKWEINGGCGAIILILLLAWAIPAIAVPIINALHQCPPAISSDGRDGEQ